MTVHTFIVAIALAVAGPSAAAPAERLVEPPRLLEFTAAEYPAAALHHATESEVRVQIQVSPEGAVSLVTPAEGQRPDSEYFLLARTALSFAKFAPARVGGRNASSSIGFIYRFAISRHEEEPELKWEKGGTVSGEVLAGGTRVAVPGVDVVAQGLGIAATTDATGHFAMDLPAGNHVLVVAAPGFLPVQAHVPLPKGNDTEVTLYPRRTVVGELSATVEGERVRTAPSKQTLQREELRNVPGSQSDPIRVIENLPGLARAPFTGGQLIVRGARPEDTGAYIDGQKIPLLYHLLQGPSVLSEDMVQKIDFLPGGADVFYGRSLGGIVAVTAKKGDPERLHGSVTSDLNKSSGFLQGPIGKDTQFALGVRRSYINPIVSLITDPKHELTLPVYWDYQARGDHQFGSADKLSLLVYGSDDTYAVVGGGAGSVPLVDGLHIGFHRLKLTWEHKVSSDVSFSVSPMLGFDINDHNSQGTGSGAFAGAQSEEERTQAYGARAELDWRVSERLSWRFGADLLFDRVRYKLDQLFDTQLRGVGAPNAEQAFRDGVRTLGQFGEYAEAELRFGALRLSPGVRLEQYHWNGRTFLVGEPRLWARYAVSDALTLYTYAGLYHEPPTAQQLDTLLGNPDLTPEAAQQYGVGFTQKIGEEWSVKIEGYLNRRSSLVYPVQPRLNDDGTIFNPVQLNSGIGRSIGLEVLIRRQLSARVYGWIAYTLSRSRELPGTGGPWQPTPFDQPHVLTALVAFRPSTQVEFSSRLRVASGNPYAPVTSSSFDADSGQYVAARLPFGSARLPTFVQLDFEVNNIWSADLWQLSLYLDFQNILNQRNPEYLVYDYRYTSNDAVHGLPFLASIGAKVSF